MRILTISFLFFFFITSCSSHRPTEEANPIPIFEAGDSNYACFRIPAIIKTTKQTLLAFCEARKGGCSDTGDIDLVVKRSMDNGKTWGPLGVVWDAGYAVAGNPAPVVDETNGRIFLLSTWNLGTDHESQIINQTSEDTRRVFVLYSDDDGVSWSGAKEITSDVKLENWTWYATGPVHGIQMVNKSFKGRLLIPCDHIEAGTNHYFSHVIFSDDRGKTWQLGGSTPQHQVNESTISELPDGRLLLNMRNYDRRQKNRKISYSDDGGETWADIQGVPSLIEPICQASQLSFRKRGGGDYLLFLNPSDSLTRKNMTLSMSKDQGITWERITSLHWGPSAYSDLVQINRKFVGCLYESGEKSPYEGIWFQQVMVE